MCAFARPTDRTPRPNVTRCAAESQAEEMPAPRYDEAKSKPATRAGVFGEPWDASWLWFAISESKPEVSNHMRQSCYK